MVTEEYAKDFFPSITHTTVSHTEPIPPSLPPSLPPSPGPYLPLHRVQALAHQVVHLVQHHHHRTGAALPGGSLRGGREGGSEGTVGEYESGRRAEFLSIIPSFPPPSLLLPLHPPTTRQQSGRP